MPKFNPFEGQNLGLPETNYAIPKMPSMPNVPHPSAAVADALKDEIREFQDALDDDHEVVIRTGAFGNEPLMIEHVGFRGPLIILDGSSQNGRVRLIQHTSRVDLALGVVEKPNNAPLRRIGFVADNPPREPAAGQAD